MSGLRFKLGEMAIYAVSAGGDSGKVLGSIVEVLMIGPFKPGDMVKCPCGCGRFGIFNDTADYFVRVASEGPMLICSDWQLRKIDGQEEPESLRRDETIEEEMPA